MRNKTVKPLKNTTADPLKTAISDYLDGNKNVVVEVLNDLTEPEELPVSYFFRDYKTMPEQEKTALNLASGTILDVGAGTGCHALELQKQGKEVTALEINPFLAGIAREAGVKKVVTGDFMEYRHERFDTILFLMNGLGIAGTLPATLCMLKHAASLLKPGGQIIGESADLLYVYETGPGEIDLDLNQESYYGELQYRFRYKGVTGKPFPWVYIDFHSLEELAHEAGLNTELLMTTEWSGYLVRLW